MNAFHIKELTVISNNDTMHFDYYYNKDIKLCTSIYIGKNGEGKSFSMRLLHEYINVLKEFNNTNQSFETRKLHYNQYILVVSSNNSNNTETEEITIDTGKIPHNRSNENNNSSNQELYSIDKITISITNKPTEYTTEEKLNLFKQLPTIIAPDYLRTGKVDTKPWLKEDKSHVVDYPGKLKDILSVNIHFSAEETAEDILNDILDSYCKLRLQLIGDEIHYSKIETINDDTNNDYVWLSSGEKAIIHNFAYILHELYQIKEGNAVLLIDEPENCLHPEWQRRYLEHLHEMISKTGIDCQILIATHSPFIISALDDSLSKTYSILCTREETHNYRSTVMLNSTYGHNTENILATNMGMTETRSTSFCNTFDKLIEKIKSSEVTDNLKNELQSLKNNLPQDDELWIFLDMLEHGRFIWN